MEDAKLIHLIETKRMVVGLGFSPIEIQAKIDSRKQILKSREKRKRLSPKKLKPRKTISVYSNHEYEKPKRKIKLKTNGYGLF